MIAVAPAGLAELFGHLAAKNGTLARADYHLLVDEVLAGRVLAGVLDETPIVLGGVFVPDGGGPCTCWFSVVPGALSGSGRLVRAVWLMRELLEAIAPAMPGGLAAYVDDANQHGQRLASALGFDPVDVSIGGLRRWMWRTRSPARRQRNNTRSRLKPKPSSAAVSPKRKRVSRPSRRASAGS